MRLKAMNEDLMCDNRKEIAKVRKVKKKYPDMPPSLKHRMDTWEKCLMGDVDATIEMTILFGMATREEFDEIRALDKIGIKKTS